jgi:dihydroflavonol-4-reductase
VTDWRESTQRTAVVTGATGFLGLNLVRYLLVAGWRVRTVGRRPLLDPDGRTVNHSIVDVRHHEELLPVFAGADVVFHLAAKITLATVDPEAWDINVRGTASVARAAREAGVGRLVHCSSVNAFDLARARPPLNERSPRSTNADRPLYDRSKAAGEVEVRKMIDGGLDATIANPTGVIGPGDPGPSRVNAIIEKAARGRLPIIVDGGFDWVDVRDVVRGLVALSERGRTGENYLLTGHRASALQLTRMAAAVNGRRGPLVALPIGLARRAAPRIERIGNIFNSGLITPASIGALVDDPVVDGSKATAELDHHPRPLAESVRDTVMWFEDKAR